MQTGDLAVELFDPGAGDGAYFGAGTIGCEQIGDLSQRKAGPLGRADKAQAAQIVVTVMAPPAAVQFARTRIEQQTEALIVTHRFHANSAAASKFGNCHNHRLTPYYGTQSIDGSVVNQQTALARTAVLHRMVMETHTCRYGVKALHLLKRKGYVVDDRWLTTREATDAFKAEHGVKTTPQVFISGERIGGYDDLRRYLGMKVPNPDAVSYVPVLAVFAAAGALALAVSQAAFDTPLTMRAGEWFISFAMVILAMLKLQDLDRFATMFLGYDLLARRWVPYASLYPFFEFGAGVLMTARLFNWLSIPVALFIGSIGAGSVFYAVYVQRRDIKCACVGGSSRVPLGFVSLSENLAMIAMALWMLARPM